MNSTLYIASKNVNLEIIAKLLNSVANNYGCHVRYDAKENSLKFNGNEAYWKHIAEEVMAFFFPKKEKTPDVTGV